MIGKKKVKSQSGDLKRKTTYRRDGSMRRDVTKVPSGFEVDREEYFIPSKSVTRYNREGKVTSSKMTASGRGVSDTPIKRVRDKVTFTKAGTVRTNKKSTTYKRKMK